MSGLTDEAVIEGHDLIERAETEERLSHEGEHPNAESAKAAQKPTGEDTAGASGARGQKSKLDSIKDALNLKK